MPSDPHMAAGAVTVAVGAIVQDGAGRILLVKHRPERGGFWQGRWIFPGGRLNPGESIIRGTEREVREETGLEIEVTRANPLAERIVDEGGAVRLHVLYITHMARRTGGRLKAASDVGEARWVSGAELARRWGELHEDTQAIARLAGLAPQGLPFPVRPEPVEGQGFVVRQACPKPRRRAHHERESRPPTLGVGGKVSCTEPTRGRRRG